MTKQEIEQIVDLFFPDTYDSVRREYIQLAEEKFLGKKPEPEETSEPITTK